MGKSRKTGEKPTVLEPEVLPKVVSTKRSSVPPTPSSQLSQDGDDEFDALGVDGIAEDELLEVMATQGDSGERTPPSESGLSDALLPDDVALGELKGGMDLDGGLSVAPEGLFQSASLRPRSAEVISVRGGTLDALAVDEGSGASKDSDALEAEAFHASSRDVDLDVDAFRRHEEEEDEFQSSQKMNQELALTLVRKNTSEDDDLGKGPGDLLRRYLKEIAQYPLLTRDEEYALAVKYHETGDRDAAWRLTTANLRLVVKIANEYRRQTMKLLDLIQEGNVGLIRAVQKFDPYRGVKLSSYASFWIRAYLLRYVMENFRLVKLGRSQSQRKIFFNLNKERKKLLDAGFVPTPKLLAGNMGVSEADVAEMELRMDNGEESLDAPSDLNDSRSFGDRFSSDEAGADDKLGDAQVLALFKSKLDDFEATLTDERERVVLRERLLVDEDPRSLQSIADQFGQTKERIRQITHQLMGKMRHWFLAEIPEFKMLSVIPEDEEETSNRPAKSPGAPRKKSVARGTVRTPKNQVIELDAKGARGGKSAVHTSEKAPSPGKAPPP